MNNDLIRREDVLKEACCGIWDIPRSEIEGVLKRVPSVEAVVPVYCKDCYNREKTDRDRFIRCVQLGIEVPDIFFCRYGDREG